MIRILRHISVRIWLSCLVGIPLSFTLLRTLNTASFTFPYPLAAGLVILLALFFLIGAILHHTGKKLVLDMISRAQSWERAGIFQKAEQYYVKAVRIYDSFLLSPVFLERTLGKKLAGAVSGFILSSGIHNPLLEQCIPKFLRVDPTDEDIALYWLKRGAFLSSSDPDAVDQDLLTRIAENHTDNTKVLPILADLFLQFRRTDFTARKIYKEAMKHPRENLSLKSRINELLSEGEEDPYETSSQMDIRIPETEHVTARPKTRSAPKASLRKGFSFPAGLLFSRIRTLGSLGKRIAFHAGSSAGRLFAYIKSRDNLLLHARRVLLTAAVVAVLVFAVNTALHLFETKAPEKTAEKIEIQTSPKPFTLQVAAYLNPRHAKEYVNKLRKEGLDVSYSKTQGGGKTWYLVRVSSFSDKQSAAAYGRTLKKKGIIDDFFVDNR